MLDQAEISSPGEIRFSTISRKHPSESSPEKTMPIGTEVTAILNELEAGVSDADKSSIDWDRTRNNVNRQAY